MSEARPARSSKHIWVSVAYVVLAIILCLIPAFGIQWFETSRTQVLIGGILTALTIGVLHVFRNRWPITVVVLGLLVMIAEAASTGTTSLGVLLIECDALYGLVIARPTAQSQRGLTIAATICLVCAVAGILLANVLAAPLLQSTTLLLALGVTLWWGITVRTPMIRASQERERAALIADAAAARQREAIAAERLQISRELHDTISGHLSAIALQSAAVSGSAPPSPQELSERVARIRTLSLDAMADMRTLIEVLRTDAPAPGALPQNWSAVRSLIEHARDSGASITVTGDDPESIRLDPLSSVAAYNAIREALVNAAKHAPGAEVLIEIRRQDEHLKLTMTNEPHAGTPAESPSSGFGLIGLAERIRLCGGALDIERSDAAWTLRVQLPLTPKREVQHA